MREFTATDAPVDRDAECFRKAKANGEPTFTLRAQDVTAPAVVDLWAHMQIWLHRQIALGFTLEESLKVIEKRCSAVFQDVPDTGIYQGNIAHAIGVALTMDEYKGPKKIAD